MANRSTELRSEDYLFGKRIADQRGKPSANFRPGAKKGLDLALRTADDLGPGGSTPLPSFTTKPSFNKKGTIGPKSDSPLKKTEVSPDPPHEVTEFTSGLEAVSSFKKPSFNRKSSWGQPASALKKTQVTDRTIEQTEFTTDVHSTIGGIQRAPSFGRPSTPRTGVEPIRRGEGTEFTTKLYSSFRVEPKSRAKTPPAATSRPSFRTPPALTDYTTSVHSSFRRVNPPPKRSDSGTKKTDWWLHIPKEDTPGPGQYFVP